METQAIGIVTTCSNEEEARKICRLLLDARLISCAHIENIASCYRWQGEIHEDAEVRLTMKTQKKHYAEIEKRILDNHSYEVPEIVAYDLCLGSAPYLSWICQETK
ncbi:MAG: divalent-cation tolerance protein CutA [Desulfovibrionaceae bacterium]|nr:divalent-cation tolerance protein CutA [Desulfovibrionaceae bacterium]